MSYIQCSMRKKVLILFVIFLATMMGIFPIMLAGFIVPFGMAGIIVAADKALIKAKATAT